MSKDVTFIYKDEKIDGAIEGIAKTAKTLQQGIHNIAVSILQVWQEKAGPKKVSQEDAFEAAKIAADRLTRLMNASPYHANAFAKWVGMFCPLQWSDENKTWYAVNDETARFNGQGFKQAKATPFWKVKPPTAPKPFVMYDELQKIYQKYVKHLTKQVEGDSFDRDAAEKIKEALDLLKEKGLATTE